MEYLYINRDATPILISLICLYKLFKYLLFMHYFYGWRDGIYWFDIFGFQLYIYYSFNINRALA